MDFYYYPIPAPCRSVLMLAEALGINLNKKLLNLRTLEHLRPEFLKINPQHMIPTLVDDGFALWESRAILIYLVEKYDKDNSLYPKCPRKRAVVNQRLYFDMDTLYLSYANYYYLHPKKGPEMYKKIEIAFDFLNTFLEGHQYAAGDTLTIADYALLATVSAFDMQKFDLSKYVNVKRWYEHCKTTAPGWDDNWRYSSDVQEWLNEKI